MQTIKTFYRGELTAGIHPMHWDGTNNQNLPVPSGVYLIDLNSPADRNITKVSLIK